MEIENDQQGIKRDLYVTGIQVNKDSVCTLMDFHEALKVIPEDSYGCLVREWSVAVDTHLQIQCVGSTTFV